METNTSSATATATATAPAAATAATTSTPVTQSAPVSVTQTDGAQGAGALPPSDSIAAMVAAAEAKGFGKPETETQTQPAATETPAAAKSETETETPAASETETPAATQTEEPSYSLERDGFVGAKDLAAEIDANPALKAALSEETRNKIMANARLAERGSQYEQFFASPAEAKIITETAQEHAAFSEAFSLIQSDAGKGTTAFIQKLIEASVLRDAEGKPIKDDKGFYRTDGTANKFVDTLGRRWLNLNIAEKVKGIEDPETRENVQAALDLVMESVGLLPSTADKTNQDPALAAREAELKRREEALTQQNQQAEQSRRTEYTQSLNTALEKVYDDNVAQLLKAATGLDKLRQRAIETELEKAITTGIKRNVAYQRRKALLQAEPMSPARQKKEIALAKEFFADNLVRLATPIFEEAGISLKKGAEARAESQAAREANSRSEVNGGRAVSPNPQTATSPGSYTEQRAQATAEWKAANPGKNPSDSDINIWMMLKSAKAKGLPVGNAA